MVAASIGEYHALDKRNWKELSEKYVLKSGCIYLGTKYIHRQVRVFIEN